MRATVTAEHSTPPAPGARDWYAYEALRALPRTLLLVDRNPFSSTYGCCDREYWHFRTADFPCGMFQVYCLPLALAYALPLPGSPYHRVPRMRELAVAAIEPVADVSVGDLFIGMIFPGEIPEPEMPEMPAASE